MKTSNAPTRTIRNAGMAKQGLAAAIALTLCTGVANAKDLYVSTSGSDSVAYASNTLSAPWKTIGHALYNLKAGDHLYIRGGTYAPTYAMWLADQYTHSSNGGDPGETMNAQSGTSSAPVVIENYNNEKAIIDVAKVSQSTFINLDNKSYWTFRGLTLINTQQAFLIGENSSSTHNTFENLTITASRGGDNQGGIAVYNGNGEYTTIRNNVITGPGFNVHQNTHCVYLRKINHATVTNNTLSNAPIGIYFKHRNTGMTQADVDIEIAYNYLSDTNRATFEWNGNFTHIHDNILGPNNAGMHFAESDGGAGGDYNLVEHNTFFTGGINLDSSQESGDPWPGAQYNTFKNNIFMMPLLVHIYSNYADHTTFANNLYPTTSAISSYSGTIALSSGSLAGKPTFTGGASPTSISGYALTSSSIGKGAGTDGGDLGARTDKMSGVSSSPPPSPPMAPGSVQVIVQ
jgi:hypothetical protein